MSSFQPLLVKFSALLCADTKETSLGGIIKMLKRYSLFCSTHWVLPELRRTQKHPFPNDTVILFLASYWLSKMKPLTSNLFIQSSLELICLERKKKTNKQKTYFWRQRIQHAALFQTIQTTYDRNTRELWLTLFEYVRNALSKSICPVNYAPFAD